MTKPWTNIPIIECREKLVSIPSHFKKKEPHPYLSLGAPYRDKKEPWRLREQTLERLSLAEKSLTSEYPELRFSIFDAWRPIRVQQFMVEHEINSRCKEKGIDPVQEKDSFRLNQITKDVYKFWAKPTFDSSTPPPHSTGGAIDLTLCHIDGTSFYMGGEIDEIDSKSEPNHYLATSASNPESRLLHDRRLILSNTMQKAGFVQHPHEWWHFSYGDQLWAWSTKSSTAIYGDYSLLESRS